MAERLSALLSQILSDDFWLILRLEKSFQTLSRVFFINYSFIRVRIGIYRRPNGGGMTRWMEGKYQGGESGFFGTWTGETRFMAGAIRFNLVDLHIDVKFPREFCCLIRWKVLAMFDGKKTSRSILFSRTKILLFTRKEKVKTMESLKIVFSFDYREGWLA